MRRWSLSTLTVLCLLAVVGLSARHAPLPSRPQPYACTSFAVYAGHPIYGMNFDYPEVELRFSLQGNGDLMAFQMAFEQEGGFADTVGMNSAGLFASCQMLFPEAAFHSRPAADEVFPWQVYDQALQRMATVHQVETYLAERRVVDWQLTLHDLIADPGGAALVVEPGTEGNAITRIDGAFIVMTNFRNADFAGQETQAVEGVGADRYRAAHEYISENLASFGVEQAMQALEQAVSLGEWATQCSLVFDPEQRLVFLALRRDFDHVWKVSFDSGTIETHAGFGRQAVLLLGPDGVLASELEAAATAPPAWAIGAAVLASAALAAGLWAVRRASRRRSEAARGQASRDSNPGDTDARSARQ